MGWLTDFIDWLALTLESFMLWLVNILKAFLGWTVDQILTGILWMFQQIPAPDFMTAYRISDFLPSEVLWFCTMCNFPEAFSMIAAATVFRTLRMILTLGIWK